MAPVRVLHYGLSSNLGGIETYLWDLSKLVDSETYTFDFLYTDTGQPPALRDELRALGSQFYGIAPRKRNPLKNRRQLKALFETNRFDILHFHANTASYIEPVQAALAAGVKVVFHSHNSGTSRSPITRAMHELNSRRLPFDRIIKLAVSEDAAAWMFRSATDVQVIPNGIDVERFRFDALRREQARTALGLGSDELVVGHVGAFLPAKNHEFILDIFRQILERRFDSTLLLVGVGPEEQPVRASASKLGISDRVRFLGRRNDIPALLSAMDSFMLPSRHEGFPLVALEAQASGARSCFSEAVPPSALVIPAAKRLPLHDPQAWADQLTVDTSMIERSDAADRVHDAGYSFEATLERVLVLYKQLMHG